MGEWTDPVEFLVERERVIRYAKATNDPTAEHLAGDLAPPVFAVVPAWDSFVAATLTAAPPELMPMVVHGEQDIHIHRPIEPGMTLISQARALGVHPGSSGTTVVIQSRTVTAAGDPVNDQFLVSFLRGATLDETGDHAPAHVFDESLRSGAASAEVTALVDADQTFRYADASGDPMPIHLDDEMARAVGLPGIIAHGLCTMAFTSWAAIRELAGGDPRRLRRLAVRFSRPVLPGNAVTTSFWASGQGTYQFETVSSGAVVVRNGLAEIGE